MPSLDPTLATAITAIIVAVISGGWAWYSGRPKAQVDYAAAIQTGFKSLIDELREQHSEDQKSIKLCNAVVQDLSSKVMELTLYISKIEFFLRVHGLWKEAPKHNLLGIPRLENGGN